MEPVGYTSEICCAARCGHKWTAVQLAARAGLDLASTIVTPELMSRAWSQSCRMSSPDRGTGIAAYA